MKAQRCFITITVRIDYENIIRHECGCIKINDMAVCIENAWSELMKKKILKGKEDFSGNFPNVLNHFKRFSFIALPFSKALFIQAFLYSLLKVSRTCRVLIYDVILFQVFQKNGISFSICKILDQFLLFLNFPSCPKNRKKNCFSFLNFSKSNPGFYKKKWKFLHTRKICNKS